jgi:hypothetical protein
MASRATRPCALGRSRFSCPILLCLGMCMARINTYLPDNLSTGSQSAQKALPATQGPAPQGAPPYPPATSRRKNTKNAAPSAGTAYTAHTHAARTTGAQSIGCRKSPCQALNWVLRR